MKKVTLPWLGVVIATSLSFLAVIFSIIFLFNIGKIKTIIYDATSYMTDIWKLYFYSKEKILGWIKLCSEVNSKPIKIFVPIAAAIVFLVQFGIFKEHKMKYTFSEMYSSFWGYTHPNINMKLIGIYVYGTYITNLIVFFAGISKMNFPAILLATISVIILQANGIKNLRDVDKWKKSIYYEENNQESQQKG